MFVLPLSIILLIMLTAIMMGHFAGSYMANNDMKELIDINNKAIQYQEKILTQLREAQSLEQTTISQMKLDTAQSTENERTMFQYLDRTQELIKNNTDVLNNLTQEGGDIR